MTTGLKYTRGVQISKGPSKGPAGQDEGKGSAHLRPTLLQHSSHGAQAEAPTRGWNREALGRVDSWPPRTAIFPKWGGPGFYGDECLLRGQRAGGLAWALAGQLGRAFWEVL